MDGTAKSSRGRDHADAPGAKGSVARATGNFRPTRFLLVFFLSLLIGFALLFTPWIQVVDAAFSRVLVRVSHAVIVGCGGHAVMQGAALRTPGGAFGVEMQDGCNGINVTILLFSAILAFPASWKVRMAGLLAGTLIIQGLNIVRFVSLFYIGQYSMSWFDFAHGYLWESLLILDTLVVFWVWVNWVFRSGAASNATP
ncbi:MAG TPA: exosortase H [Bryobacteraceae bacterium]|nr:exosortase H [Bryobacteraceae bacterium]